MVTPVITPCLRSVAMALCLTATLLLWAAPAVAGRATNTFDVKVTLSTVGNGGGSNVLAPALCRNSTSGDAFGARATVVCSTGALVDLSPGTTKVPWAPMHGGAFRYATQVSLNGEWIDAIDDRLGTGTITTWRVVRSATHNYLELTVGW